MTALKDLIKNPTTAELSLIAAYAGLRNDAARERSFKVFANTGLPHRRMEAWKWTDFKAGLSTLEDGAAPRVDPFADIDGHVLRFDGKRVQGLDDLPDGIRVIAKDTGHGFAANESVPLGALTAALTRQTILLDISAKIETPIRLVYTGSGESAFSRIAFVVREGGSVDVIESHLGGAGLNSALTGYELKASARATRTLIQPPAPGEATAITSQIHLDAKSHFTQTVLAFGGDVARIETRAVHQDPEAELVMNAAYLAGDGYHIDMTSHVRHGGRNCVTKQRTKGAVMAGGTGVFQGKFHVPMNVGQQTDADMQHNALLLEDGAVVNAKPELEIYADDVECAHGNTCGALDAEALFYMRQRGIPEATAKALLTEAFVAEALETAFDGADEIMLEAAREWLKQ